MGDFKFLAVIPLVFLSVTFAKAEEKEKVEKVSGFLSVGAYNRYIFRGYELSRKSIVIQPSITLSYKGFSINSWANIDTDEHSTQSFTPDRKGKKSLNESDLTFMYTYSIEKFSFSAGYTYYGTKYTTETEEVFLSASYDIFTKPTLTIYRDISTYPGTYLNLSFSHSFPLYKGITLDLFASFGYFKGDDNYWRTYEKSTGNYTGERYSAFHDGKLQAGLTIPISNHTTLQPNIQYWFPLSDRAKRKIEGKSYNPSGHLDNTFVAGLNFNFNF